MEHDRILALAELLCARLCHDLAGPLGALGTGAELLAEEGAGLDAEATALIASSAAIATARLRFLRFAFGPGGGGLAPETVRSLVADYLKAQARDGAPLILDWRDESGASWEPDAVKILCNLVLLALDCLPRGGGLAIRARPGDGAFIAEVAARGAPSGRPAVLAGIEATEADGLTPRGAQGFYAAKLVQSLKWTLGVAIESDVVRLRVSCGLA